MNSEDKKQFHDSERNDTEVLSGDQSGEKSDGLLTVCPNCGREIEKNDPFCRYCGKPTAPVSVQDMSGSGAPDNTESHVNKKGRLSPIMIATTAILSVTVIILAIVVALFIRNRSDSHDDYSGATGTDTYQSSMLGGTGDTVFETDDQKEENVTKEETTAEPIETEKPLPEMFDLFDNIPQKLSDFLDTRSVIRYLTKEETEQFMASLAETDVWYIDGTDDTYPFDGKTIDGRPFYILTALQNYYDGSNIQGYEIFFTYDPDFGSDEYYYIAYMDVGEENWFGESTFVILNTDSEKNYPYLWITSMSYSEKQQMIIDNRKPAFSDDYIVQSALKEFERRMKSKYGGGVNTLYHAANLKGSMVTFDKVENAYYCTLNATYTTNIFDIYGTSTSYYVVSAVYYDNGDGTVLLGSFSIE